MPVLIMSRPEVAQLSKRPAPCSLWGRRTSAQGLPRSFPLLSLWSGHFLHNGFLSEIMTVRGSWHIAYAHRNQVVGRTPVPDWQCPHRAGINEFCNTIGGTADVQRKLRQVRV